MKKDLFVTQLYLFWAIWMERDRLVFDNGDFSFHRLKNSFV